MNTFSTEKELQSVLDAAEGLIIECVSGQITFDTFLEKYDNFYMRYALDGHESDDNERVLLRKYADRIRLHEMIWHKILVKVTTDEFFLQQGANGAEFISKSDGFVQLRRLVQDHLE